MQARPFADVLHVYSLITSQPTAQSGMPRQQPTPGAKWRITVSTAAIPSYGGGHMSSGALPTPWRWCTACYKPAGQIHMAAGLSINYLQELGPLWYKLPCLSLLRHFIVSEHIISKSEQHKKC